MWSGRGVPRGARAVRGCVGAAGVVSASALQLSPVDELRAALQHIEDRATGLPWAKQRPWTVATHVWDEAGLPVADLHDLSVKLGLAVVETVAELGSDLPAGAVTLIPGRGKHTPGKATLRDAVRGALMELARANDYVLFPRGPGRFVLITDAERAPAAATGRPGPLFWAVVALVVAGGLATLWSGLGG
jgi:hypothetical protein